MRIWEKKENIAVNTVHIYEIKKICRVKGGNEQMKPREDTTIRC